MKISDPFLVLGLVLSLVTVGLFCLSMTVNERSGTLEVTITGTRGIDLGELKDGRLVQGRYSSDAPINVYLMTYSEAEDMRNPSYYEEPILPDPIHSGRNGSFSIRIEKESGYELVFWNESFNGNHFVDYNVDTGRRINDPPFLTSLISLLMLSAILLTIAYMRGRRKSALGGPMLRE